MNYFTHCFLFCFIRYTTTEFVALNRKAHNPHCEGAEKNAVIEHFFNVIFAEFHSTPPVCVCVQMCVGQSTYCYPNACLKRDDLRRVDSPQIPGTKSDKKQFMFVIDEKPELVSDFSESHQIEDTKVATSSVRPLLPYNADYFKDNNFRKYRKHLPQVELRYNLREQVKNLKIENTDLSKTRWPMNNQYNHNILSGHKLRTNVEKVPPVVGRSKFFMSMLTDNNVADYPPKYFKRDIKKSADDYERNLKEVYVYDTPDNVTDFTSFSLEALIDNLIKINHESTSDMMNTSIAKINSENKYITGFDEFNVIPLNLTVLPKPTNISINFNQDIDNNKYTEQNESTNKISGMILNLEKRIEKQNNTSMEMAKRIVTDVDLGMTSEEVIKENDIKETNNILNEIDESINKTDNIRSVSIDVNNQTILIENDGTEPTTVTETVETTVTRKVKLRVPRKSGTKNMN